MTDKKYYRREGNHAPGLPNRTVDRKTMLWVLQTAGFAQNTKP